MNIEESKKTNKLTIVKSILTNHLRWVLIFLAAVAGIGSFAFLQQGSGKTSTKGSVTCTVIRGDLPITVTSSGNIKALNSKDLSSAVEGRTTIISLVDEGTYITPEDVNNGKVLVELDSSTIKQKATEQQISFLTVEASHTEAKEALDIQIKQNTSDIKAGETKVRFALMDLQKYLGEVVAEKIIDKTAEHNEIASLIEDAELGGESLQKLRELRADINLKEQELAQAKSTLEWTEKLYEKNYVSRSNLEADRLSKNRCNISLEKAMTAKDLFIKYEFPKETEKRLNDYSEAKRELERIEAGARSKLAQAQAKLESAKATYALQKELLEKWRKQLQACVIKAPSPGQVVYASSMMDTWMKRNNPIEIGAEVRERQKIISIPDLTTMKIEVKIHEAWIDKVQVGQEAKITVTAFPEKTFTGKIIKKAPLADPENWWNPDLKLYTVDVSIDGTHDFLKTGMTAKVEIMVDELKNVLTIPLQTVINKDGRKVCYVTNGREPKECEITTGAFNDNFVEVQSGLVEGEKVLLSPPRLTESKGVAGKSGSAGGEKMPRSPAQLTGTRPARGTRK